MGAVSFLVRVMFFSSGGFTCSLRPPLGLLEDLLGALSPSLGSAALV